MPDGHGRLRTLAGAGYHRSMADLPGRVRSPTSRRDLEAGLGPLAGIRVADCSTVLAGPYCTMLLADLGADVIKVEPPEGDATRGWGPPWVGDEADGTRTAAYFLAVNRNKRSIRLDLKTRRRSRGPAPAPRAIRRARRELPRRRRWPRSGSATRRSASSTRTSSTSRSRASAPTAPMPAKPGYDFVIQAVGGLMSITGATDEDGGRPTKVGVAISDVVTGLFGAVSILAGAARPRRDAADGHPRASGSTCRSSSRRSPSSSTRRRTRSSSGAAPVRLGNAHPNIVPYETFRTADGELAVAVGSERQWPRLCEAHRVARARRGPVVRDQRRPRRPSRRPPPDPRVAVRGPDDGRVGRGARCRRHPVRADQRRHRGVRVAAGRRARDDRRGRAPGAGRRAPGRPAVPAVGDAGLDPDRAAAARRARGRDPRRARVRTRPTSPRSGTSRSSRRWRTGR